MPLTPNQQKFQDTLEKQYEYLFANDKNYKYAKSIRTAKELAVSMTESLTKGHASKDGLGIIRTCKELKIAHTYKAISEYLKA
jgi:hypothetical protein